MHVVRLYIVWKALSSESDSNHFAGPYKKNNYAQATHIRVQNRNKTKKKPKKSARMGVRADVLSLDIRQSQRTYRSWTFQ